MNSLLFKALCTRLMTQQWKALLFASLSVALGLALALAIRLGTESAALNLKKNLETLQQPHWVGPVRVHNAAAERALEPFYARFSYKTTRVADAFWVHPAMLKEGNTTEPRGRKTLEQTDENKTAAEGAAEDPAEPVTLVLMWSGDSRVAGTQSLGAPDFTSVSKPDIPLVFVPEHCLTKHEKTERIRAFSREFTVQVVALPRAAKEAEPGAEAEGDENTSCAVAFASGPAWRALPQFAGQPLETDALNADSISFYSETPSQQKDLEQQLAVLAASVPGLQFEPQAAQVESLGKLTQSFNINLQLMGFIAIFIGVFMVHHVFSLLIAKNAQMIAIVHAQGISLRKQIFPLFCVAACLGTVASIVGIVLGVGLGRVLSLITQSTVQALYARMLDAHAFYWNPRELIFAFVLGLGASLVGAANPVLKMRHMDSAQVLKTGVWESGSKCFSLPTTLFILIASGTAIAVMVRYPLLIGRLPVGAFVSCLLILFLNALFAKDVCVFLYKKAGLKSLNHRFLMQLRIFMPPQAGVVLQVLCLGFALTLSVKSMAESFRQTLTNWVNTTLKADVWVRSTDGSATPLPPEVVAAVDAYRFKMKTGDVVAIDALRVLPATFLGAGNSFPITFNGVRMQEHAVTESLKFLDSKSRQKELSLEIHRQAKFCQATQSDPCPAYISEALSIHASELQGLGKTFEINVSGHHVFFKVAAVVQDFGNDSGIVMSDIALVQRLFDENPNPSFMNLYLRDKSVENATQVLHQIEKELVVEKGFALNLFTLVQLRQRVMEAFENTFRITDALYVLCAAIAFISVYTCLNLQLLLRRREWNILWALGLGEKRLRKGMALWAGNMAFVACVVSLAGGLSIAALLVYVVNYYAFGYSLELSLPWSFIGGVLVLAWVSGAVSGWVVAAGLQKHLSSHLLQLE